ncbi:MAG: hypothetical protein Q9218_006853 [Villophora microphyllina]
MADQKMIKDVYIDETTEEMRIQATTFAYHFYGQFHGMGEHGDDNFNIWNHQFSELDENLREIESLSFLLIAQLAKLMDISDFPYREELQKKVTKLAMKAAVWTKELRVLRMSTQHQESGYFVY